MSTYSLYDATTGLFTGRVLDVADADLAANTPEGQAAWPGTVAPDRKVDVGSDSLAATAPRSPPGEQWVNEAGRWRLLPTLATQGQHARLARNRLLTQCDWIAVRAYEAGITIPSEWAAYRQALRDLPSQPGWPTNITWPAQPASP